MEEWNSWIPNWFRPYGVNWDNGHLARCEERMALTDFAYSTTPYPTNGVTLWRYLRTRNASGEVTSYFNWSPYSHGIDELENMGTLVMQPVKASCATGGGLTPSGG